MKLNQIFTAITVFVFLVSASVSQQEAIAQESPTPEQQALIALEKATEAMGAPIKFDGYISQWTLLRRYQKEEAALQEKLTEWQDNRLDLSERVVEAEKLIEDWRKKVEELRELLSQGADPDMGEVLYSLITDSWLDGAEGLEEAANKMEMAIKESDTDASRVPDCRVRVETSPSDNPDPAFMTCLREVMESCIKNGIPRGGVRTVRVGDEFHFYSTC